MKTRKVIFPLALLIITIAGCSTDYAPKPKDYPHISFPEKAYQTYSSDFCPLTFEYPVYAEVYQDTVFFEEQPEHPCWLNIVYPDYNATIHLSYKGLGGEYSLQKLQEDAHKLSYKHTKRADYINPQLVETEDVFGLIYEVGGDAASATQFYLTDTTGHFLRGALYIRATPNVDSLAPVISFINQDIGRLIETLEWK